MTYDTTNPVTVSAEALRAAFKALASQIDEVRVVPDEKGWHVFGLAADRASMVNVDVNTEAFSAYEVWKPFAVRTEMMLEVLSKAGDDLTARFDEAGCLVMTIGRFTFRRNILEDFEEYPRVPKGELTLEFAVSAEVLKDVASVVSEKEAKNRALSFTQGPEGLVMESFEYDDAVNTVSVTVPAAEMAILEGEGSSTYAHRLIREIAAAVPKGTDVDIMYGHANLMKVSYSVGGADMTFVLAPWIEEE